MQDILDFNECYFNGRPCGVHGLCLNQRNKGFDCSCFTGFSKRNNWVSGTVDCQDINECEESQNPCTGPFEVCENTQGSFTCDCQSSGFRRDYDASNCTDVDECTTECQHHLQKCENSVGSYECSCNKGAVLDTITSQCVDIDECALSADVCDGPHKTCENSVGSFFCPCISGFKMITDTSECKDIDDCSDSSHNCLTSPNTFCLNYPGSFVCG